MTPANEAGSLPTVGSECIESPVIPHPVECVSRHRLIGDRSEGRPAQALPRVRGHDFGHRRARFRRFESPLQPMPELRRWFGKTGFGRSRSREMNTARVAHAHRLRREYMTVSVITSCDVDFDSDRLP